MRLIKHLLRVIFAPYSLKQTERASNGELEFFSKHRFIIVILAMMITALIMLVVYFI